MLVRMLVHDMEKPLAVTARVLQRVLSGRFDPANEGHARLIRSSALTMQRSQRMLADLGEVISRRRIPVYFQEIGLGDLAERIAGGFLPLVEMEAQKFVWHCGEDIRVHTDPDLVARVADNFLNNALNHNTAETPIRMDIRGLDGGGFRLSVANQGTRIPPEQMDTIFDPGVQLHLRRARLWRGQGLGLAFCRLAAEALGGHVSVSNLPHGSGVEFDLTIVPQERDRQPARQVQTKKPRDK